MRENDSNSDMELAPQVAPEGFLDTEPLVDVDSLSYHQQQTYQRQEVLLQVSA